jgi:thiamine-phosphate pyrophosphorylase
MIGPTLFPAALRLIYVVDIEESADVERIDAVLRGGVSCLWLRDPAATGRKLYEAAGSLLLRCRRLDAALLVGDRVDVALAIGADGVQLGHRSVPPATVRPWYRGWMGVSGHDLRELASAEAAGADHVIVSPVFGVPDKGPALGPDGLAALVRATRLPAIALGGIEPGNVARVRAVPVAGVAVIRALRDAPDPSYAARLLSGPVGSAP